MTNREKAEQKAFELQLKYIKKMEIHIIDTLTNPKLKGNPLNLSFPLAAGLMAVCSDLLDYIYEDEVKGDEDAD